MTKELRRQAKIELARRDPVRFNEFVLKDENGRRFKLAEIHRTWHEHVAYARSVGKFPCILAPWGHGKTQELVIGHALYEIGLNQNIRIKIVCNNDEKAIERVVAISRYIQRDENYHDVFPHIKPALKEKWTQHDLFVERTAGANAIDPTVDANGVLVTSIGGRCDHLIFDDIVDLRNAIEEPALQPKVIESVKNGWLSRLEPWGWALYVATRWTESDCTAAMLNDPELSRGYCFLIQRVSEDMSRIECERIG